MAVTVVIPAYNNFGILQKCLDSLKAHLSSEHTILVLDDCSPEAGFEEKTRAALEQLPNARYERNAENLGFVQTCNKAVLELDSTENDILLLNTDTVVTERFLEEMSECLHAHERHAVCCPRSNDATILTIPQYYSGDKSSFEDTSIECWKKMQHFLPQYSTIPTGVGFCMLIKREMIRRFGLFDEKYGRGYCEENDFCMRLSRFGFSTIMANYAYVFHEHGASFSSKESQKLKRINAAKLTRAYPEYQRSVEEYQNWNMSTCEYFADILGACYPKQKILLDYSHLIALHNGTNEYSISILPYLYKALCDEFDVTVLIHKKTADFFNLQELGINMLYTAARVQERFDLSYTPNQIFSLPQLHMLNRLAVRQVMTVHDVIALRCAYLREPSVEYAFRLALTHADGLISISDTVLSDIRKFFGKEFTDNTTQLRQTIIHGMELHSTVEEDDTMDLPDEPFLFIIGNHYKHKAIEPCLDALDKTVPVVLVGDKKDFVHRDNVMCLKNGNLSPEQILTLYRRAKGIVFPSQYEGFGLPILHAHLNGKRILVQDSEINREVVERYDIAEYVVRFSDFADLNVKAQAMLQQPDLSVPTEVRTWQEVALETAGMLRTIARQPPKIDALKERFLILSAHELLHHHVRIEFSHQPYHAKIASLIGRKLLRYPRLKIALSTILGKLRLLPRGSEYYQDRASS